MRCTSRPICAGERHRYQGDPLRAPRVGAGGGAGPTPTFAVARPCLSDALQGAVRRRGTQPNRCRWRPDVARGPDVGGGPRAVRSGARRTSGHEMIWWAKLLAVWAPFVVIAMLVIAFAAVHAWLERRSERLLRYESSREVAQPSTQAPAPPRGRHAAVEQPPPQPVSIPPQPAQPSPPPPMEPAFRTAPEPPAMSTAELRRWARNTGLRVADRGPVPTHVREAWLKAHRTGEAAALPPS
jgi:hypothetical protein